MAQDKRFVTLDALQKPKIERLPSGLINSVVHDAVKEIFMFAGDVTSFLAGGLLASSLTSWIREITRGSQSHILLYPVVITGLLLSLWLVYLFFPTNQQC